MYQDPAGQAAGRPFVEYGGFWSRVIALIIDGISIYIATIILTFIIGPFILFIIPFSGWLYFATLESSPLQGTLGKRAMGLKVTTLDGRPISFLRATGRYLSKILSGAIFLIGYIMVAFSTQKRGLHDIIAGTVVVKHYS